MATSEPLLPTPRSGDSKGGTYQYDNADHSKPRPTLTGIVQSGRSSSRVDSRVSLFLPPVADEVRRTIATSGQRCFASYKSLIRNGSSVKTLAAFLLGMEVWYSSRCSLIWKAQVIRRKRLLFRLAVSTPHIAATESGLLATPQAETGAARKEGEWNGTYFRKANGKKSQTRLTDQVSMLPTPRSADGEKGTRSAEGHAKERMRRKNGEDLPTRLAMLKTPSASDAEGGIMEIREGADAKYKLRDQIPHFTRDMAPTPSTRDYKGASAKKGRDTLDSVVETGARKGQTGIKTGLKLQPPFALWMMGFPADWCDLKAGEMPHSKPQVTPSSRKSRKR